MNATISEVDSKFNNWQGLLALLHQAFEYQNDRINPPSSLHKLDVASISKKSQQEKLYLAWQEKELVGCVFIREQKDSMYVGKLAIKYGYQGLGIGKQLMTQAQNYAKSCGFNDLELQVRIELIENQQTFKRMGFVESGRTIHAGFSQPTSITMRKKI
jgi:ribosomal protein S18 acetylase RimI-like enzyme